MERHKISVDYFRLEIKIHSRKNCGRVDQIPRDLFIKKRHPGKGSAKIGKKKKKRKTKRKKKGKGNENEKKKEKETKRKRK